jgi:hypothetical protein
MTEQQKKEFAQLQMAYIEAVKNNEKSAQIIKMDLIFYWLKKQINAEVLVMSISSAREAKLISRLSDNQRLEFGLLQIAFISALAMEDREPAIEVEIKMRKWIDDQIQRAVEKVIMGSAKMRIVAKTDPNNLSKN